MSVFWKSAYLVAMTAVVIGACAAENPASSAESNKPSPDDLRVIPPGDASQLKPIALPGAASGENQRSDPVPESTMSAIAADIARRSATDSSAIKVIYSRVVTWPDGSLGCPEPGHQYTQALVPGYQVIVTDGVRKYDYRTDQRDRIFLCERSLGIKIEPGRGIDPPDDT